MLVRRRLRTCPGPQRSRRALRSSRTAMRLVMRRRSRRAGRLSGARQLTEQTMSSKQSLYYIPVRRDITCAVGLACTWSGSVYLRSDTLDDVRVGATSRRVSCNDCYNSQRWVESIRAQRSKNILDEYTNHKQPSKPHITLEASQIEDNIPTNVKMHPRGRLEAQSCLETPESALHRSLAPDPELRLAPRPPPPAKPLSVAQPRPTSRTPPCSPSTTPHRAPRQPPHPPSKRKTDLIRHDVLHARLLLPRRAVPREGRGGAIGSSSSLPPLQLAPELVRRVSVRNITVDVRVVQRHPPTCTSPRSQRGRAHHTQLDTHCLCLRTHAGLSPVAGSPCSCRSSCTRLSLSVW